MKGHAEIAGGGIGGLSLGMMLARSGWTVRVHERSEDIREIGAGIYIKHNSLSVLEEFGLFEAFSQRSTCLQRAQIRDGSGRLMITRPHDSRTTRVHVLTRQALIEVLHEGAREAGVEVVTGSKIVAADPSGALRSDRGERFEADLVVGCDGFNSEVRKSLAIETRQSLLPTHINRYLLPHRRFTPEAVTTEYSSGQRRIGVTPAGEATTYVFMVCPVAEEAACALPLDVATWARSHPAVPDLLEELRRTPATAYQYGLVRCRNWHRGRAALIGDAATGMPPTLGQGAGLTIMNARSLVEALRQARNVEQALDGWERSVRQVSDLTQSWALRWDWITRSGPAYSRWLRPLALGVIGAVPAINRRIRIADRGLDVVMPRLRATLGVSGGGH
jgi:2-polyprenyl-6-methoxyphenol hydroxylase-like FAD-dependent oxidoreductase